MKTLSIDVRPAEPRDAFAISDVHRVSWLQAYGGLIPHKPLNQMVDRRNESWWRKATRGPSTLLVDRCCRRDRRLCDARPQSRPCPAAGGRGLRNLFSRPEYQGHWPRPHPVRGGKEPPEDRSAARDWSSGASRTAIMPIASFAPRAGAIYVKAWRISAKRTSRKSVISGTEHPYSYMCCHSCARLVR